MLLDESKTLPIRIDHFVRSQGKIVVFLDCGCQVYSWLQILPDHGKSPTPPRYQRAKRCHSVPLEEEAHKSETWTQHTISAVGLRLSGTCVREPCSWVDNRFFSFDSFLYRFYPSHLISWMDISSRPEISQIRGYVQQKASPPPTPSLVYALNFYRASGPALPS